MLTSTICSHGVCSYASGAVQWYPLGGQNAHHLPILHRDAYHSASARRRASSELRVCYQTLTNACPLRGKPSVSLSSPCLLCLCASLLRDLSCLYLRTMSTCGSPSIARLSDGSWWHPGPGSCAFSICRRGWQWWQGWQSLCSVGARTGACFRDLACGVCCLASTFSLVSTQ